jgi:hypothetical protein
MEGWQVMGDGMIGEFRGERPSTASKHIVITAYLGS